MSDTVGWELDKQIAKAAGWTKIHTTKGLGSKQWGDSHYYGIWVLGVDPKGRKRSIPHITGIDSAIYCWWDELVARGWLDWSLQYTKCVWYANIYAHGYHSSGSANAKEGAKVALGRAFREAFRQ